MRITFISFCFWVFIINSSAFGGVSSVDKDLRQLVCRRCVIGFDGYVLEEPLANYMAETPPGGVILFDRNIEGESQLKALVASIRKACAPKPVLIMVDQEGGPVARLRPKTGFPEQPPSAEVLGKLEPNAAYEAGKTIGENLKSVGIDMDLAPVLDIGYPGGYLASRGRTFGETAAKVALYGAAFSRGLHSSSVFNCLKHFPGHGSAIPDPHQSWTDVTSVYQDEELMPFATLIQENLADAIMVGHLFNEKWDDKLPASLSPKVIQQLLREQLKYKGLVLTDDLHMAGAAHSPGQAALLALLAGADLYLDTGTGHEPHPSSEWTVTMLKEHTTVILDALQTHPELYERLQAAEKRLDSFWEQSKTPMH